MITLEKILRLLGLPLEHHGTSSGPLSGPRIPPRDGSGMSNKKIGPKIPFDMLNEPPLMKVGPARPTLEKLLRLDSKYELTPQEVWDQRISFVLGNSSFKGINKITREKVEARATEMYGPRPTK